MDEEADGKGEAREFKPELFDVAPMAEAAEAQMGELEPETWLTTKNGLKSRAPRQDLDLPRIIPGYSVFGSIAQYCANTLSWRPSGV